MGEIKLSRFLLESTRYLTDLIPKMYPPLSSQDRTLQMKAIEGLLGVIHQHRYPIDNLPTGESFDVRTKALVFKDVSIRKNARRYGEFANGIITAINALNIPNIRMEAEPYLATMRELVDRGNGEVKA